MIPVENGEDMQVLRYELGQKYDAHHDVGELDSKSGQQLAADGGFRAATALLYLSDVEEGGETGACVGSRWKVPVRTSASNCRPTVAARARASRHAGGWAGLTITVFPYSEWIDETKAKETTYSECGSMGVAAKPRKCAPPPSPEPPPVSLQLSARTFRPCRGDVLLFWSITLEGKIDPASMHAGCPVIQGTKWTGTKWLHQRPFRWTAPPKPGIPEGCEDQHINCPVRSPVWQQFERARRAHFCAGRLSPQRANM
jgi:prolyl 4-hydroxylase